MLLGAATAHCLGHLEQPCDIFSHPFDLHQLPRGRFQYRRQTAEPLDQPMGNGIGVLLRHPIKQQQLQQRVILKASFSHCIKTLFQAVTMPCVQIRLFYLPGQTVYFLYAL